MDNIKGRLSIGTKVDKDGEIELEWDGYSGPEYTWLNRLEALALAEHIQKVFSSDNTEERREERVASSD